MRSLPAIAFTAVLFSTSAGVTAVIEEGKELWWAGHQVVIGSRSIPILGDVQTRTDSLVLARVYRTGDELELSQTACDVRFARVAGVTSSMRPTTIRQLPTAHITLQQGPGNSWRGVGAQHGWDRRDVDGDGHPGATVVIDSPLCGGDLYVGSRTTTRIIVYPTDHGFVGSVSVRVQQSIHGASGWCLSKAASGTDEVQRGHVRYTPIAAGTTCEALTERGWPRLDPDEVIE